jgi:hypothetical protein
MIDENPEQPVTVQRPFLLSIVCISIFTYSILFIILFISATLGNRWITEVLNDFLSIGAVTRKSILIFSGVGMFLYVLSFIGAVYIWKLKRKGFYLLLTSSLLIISLPYIYQFGNLLSAIILLLLNMLVLIHFRKLS